MHGDTNDVVDHLVDQLADRIALTDSAMQLASRLEEANKAAIDSALAFVEAIKEYEESGGEEAQKEEVERRRKHVAAGEHEVHELIEELDAELGIPPGEIDRLLAHTTPTDQRRWRAELTRSEVQPTAYLADSLPAVLPDLMARVDQEWFEANRQLHARSRVPYASGEISLAHGIWPAGYESPIHRYAHALLLCEDFLAGREDFESFMGSVLIPQVCTLGLSLGALKSVPGSDDRIEHLWSGPTTEVESTIYELLVAAALGKRGWQPEFLTPTAARKTPDLRLNGGRLPIVVECKRQQSLGDYERDEEVYARTLFATVADAAPGRVAGVFDLVLTRPLDQLGSETLSASIWSEPTDTGWSKDFEFGSIVFRPLTEHVRMRTLTRIFSPNYLRKTFGWSIDDPSHDGYWARVVPPDRVWVDEARYPLGFAWTVSDSDVFDRRCRSVIRLFGEAVGQVPAGEQGVIYLAYQEGHREEVADARTERILQSLQDSYHRSTILVPFGFINRFYPSPMADGDPDVIENCMMMYGYGDPSGCEDFPCTVLTPM